MKVTLVSEAVIIVCMAVMSVTNILSIQNGESATYIPLIYGYAMYLAMFGEHLILAEPVIGSPLRRYLFLDFSVICNMTSGIILFLAEFVPKYIIGNVYETDPSVWGGYSVMSAILITVSAVVIGFAYAYKWGFVPYLILAVFLFLIMFDAVKIDFGAFDFISGHPIAVCIFGTVLIILGNIGLYFGKKAGYKRSIKRPVQSAVPDT